MGVNVPFESIAVQNVTAIHNHKIDPGETVKKTTCTESYESTFSSTSVFSFVRA